MSDAKSSKRQNEDSLVSEISKKPKEEQSEETKNQNNSSAVCKYMPMKNASKNVNNSFKNPFKTIEQNLHKDSNRKSFSPLIINKNAASENIKSEIDRIKEEIETLDKEIEALNTENYELGYLDRVIDKLHLYNDIKDVAQTLLEKMAHIKGATIRQMHLEYDLDPDLD